MYIYKQIKIHILIQRYLNINIHIHMHTYVYMLILYAQQSSILSTSLQKLFSPPLLPLSTFFRSFIHPLCLHKNDSVAVALERLLTSKVMVMFVSSVIDFLVDWDKQMLPPDHSPTHSTNTEKAAEARGDMGNDHCFCFCSLRHYQVWGGSDE